MANEYRYPLPLMGRDVAVPVMVDGKRRSRLVDIAQQYRAWLEAEILPGPELAEVRR